MTFSAYVINDGAACPCAQVPTRLWTLWVATPLPRCANMSMSEMEVEISYPACRNYRHLPLCYAPKSSVGMPIGRVNAPAQRAGTHVVG